MVKSPLKALVISLVFLFVLGFLFPTVTSLITEKALPNQSEGQPIKIDGKVYGSYLLAEAFNSSIFFHPRPSAIGYNLSESGSYPYSLGNPEVLNLTEKYLDEFLKDNPGINASQIPYAMLSYSASGLDPNIPLQGALIQIPRISIALHSITNNSVSLWENYLNDLVNKYTTQNFPFFGSYYVNIMYLNVNILEYLMNNGYIKSLNSIPP
ncbi:K+-transporting ATPase C chain [Thermoplasma volcanium GSS1]|uniref:Potassium-transporting ATPase KdpC subunit n=1 Tax=Thermoplasma volcanium (strain ATCC 51530 / DSM 4299 / JCM 9571 / NBRC 15438 / GSS1) TaxID=273116 RepID=KDPC_THEVO|nr:potassium-transporting ATPase subunit KdpC [Thermoplasma volcanium]Q97BF5.1 RecName: Full=Potassium-transporting ATPase KdpC subunit; AltName: Full=ATP phosphohydrolase [potassium-transporting] C chain; AltName: Full=Potassium-binding and translocating subunit C; AltName: Full=Potassium-translocating ATPase C chain [Thermoplasma volcanium GSS1]BAB59643.1 K+-transporting ATPase C chain [Thermoplasma volcanium GSS1]